MKIREWDDLYRQHQRRVNMVHSDLTFEGPSEVATANKTVADIRKWDYATFLEVGTRTGLTPMYVARTRLFARIAGIDIVPEFIRIAKIRNEICEMGKNPFPRPEYLVGDMHKLRYEDMEFEYVCSHATLEHSHNPKQAMKEIFRVCSERIYLTIDLCNGKDDNVSHFATHSSTEDWLDLVPPEFHVDHAAVGDELTLIGYRK